MAAYLMGTPGTSPDWEAELTSMKLPKVLDPPARIKVNSVAATAEPLKSSWVANPSKVSDHETPPAPPTAVVQASLSVKIVAIPEPTRTSNDADDGEAAT